MDNQEKPTGSLQIFQDFADKLTVRRIVNALIAGILALSLYTLFENRVKVLDQIVEIAKPNQSDWTVSEATQQELQHLVENNSGIKLILITLVDLQKNRRVPKYWFLDDPSVSAIKQKAANMLPQAVFDYDTKNTQQMVGVLNNEFVCSKYADTVFARFFPELEKGMPYICRLAVPPFYGRFVGILTFGLTSEPSPEQIVALKIEASRLAIQIYLHDVMKHK